MDRVIKLFISSSIVELSSECDELVAFVNSLNKIYRERDIFFEIKICEDLDQAANMEWEKDRCCQFIRQSQYFYMLFGKKAEDYVVEQFDVALDQFRVSGAPRIYTCFRRLSDGETAEKGVMDFMELLDRQLGHYYETYLHLDTVKLRLMLELSRDPLVNSIMEFKDGKALLDSQEVLPLENVPLYGRNEALCQMRERKRQLDKLFKQLAVKLTTEPDNEELLEQMGTLGSERAALQKELHQTEIEVLGLYQEITDKRCSGRRLDWREEEAVRLADAGDYEGAKRILRDAKWDQEIADAEETLALTEQSTKEKVREYISGKRSLIATLKATGLNQANVAEITAVYEKSTALAEKYRIELEVLYEYAGFLLDQNRFVQGIAITERLWQYYGQSAETAEEDKGKLLCRMGILYNNNCEYHESESRLREALAIYQNLELENEGMYRPFVAQCCRNLGNTLFEEKCSSEAEPLLRKSLEITRELVAKNPKYKEDVALTCQSLSYLLRDQTVEILLHGGNQAEEAVQLSREALQISRELVQKDPETYEDFYVKSCNNLARMLEYNKEQREEVELLYREALEVSRKLAEKNPEAYRVGVFVQCNNLATLLGMMERYEEAEPLCREALKIAYGLAEKNPEAYLSLMAKGIRNLAVLLCEMAQYEEAEQLWYEALYIYHHLLKKDYEVYRKDVAECYQNFSMLLTRIKRNDKAAEMMDKASDYDPVYYDRESKTLSINFFGGIFSLDVPEQYLAYFESQDSKLLCPLPMKNMESKEDAPDSFCFWAVELNRLMCREKSEVLCREALEFRRKFAETAPESDNSIIAFACHNLATLMDKMGKKKEAESLYREALELRRKLAQKAPDGHNSDLANTCHHLAVLLEQAGRKEEAGVLWREALELSRKLAGANSKVSNGGLYQKELELRRKLAVMNFEDCPGDLDICYELAHLLESTGRKEEVGILYRDELKRRHKLAETNSNVWYTGNILNICHKLAAFLKEMGQKEEVIDLYREELEFCRKWMPKEVSVKDIYIWKICEEFADILCETGFREEAESLYRAAMERLESIRPIEMGEDYHRRMVIILKKLASLLRETDRKEEVEVLYYEEEKLIREANERQNKTMGLKYMTRQKIWNYNEMLADCCIRHAVLLTSMDRYEEAEPLYREGVKILRRWTDVEFLADSKSDPELDISEEELKGIQNRFANFARVCNNFAMLLYKMDQREEAEALYREELGICRELARQNPKVYNRDLTNACYGLAHLLEGTGQKEEIEALYCEALEFRHGLV